MIKKLLKSNPFVYKKLSFINRVTPSLWIINFIFQRIFRRHSKLPISIHFTSTINETNIKYHKDLNTLTSFAVSGHCYFQSYNGIVLGKNILFAPGVKIISSNHTNNKDEYTKDEPIVIGDNVWIGANVVILPSVKIGNNCIIGAGSIVTKSFTESNLIIAGNPAKVIGKKEI